MHLKGYTLVLIFNKYLVLDAQESQFSFQRFVNNMRPNLNFSCSIILLQLKMNLEMHSKYPRKHF